MKFLILSGIADFGTLGAHIAHSGQDAISLIESLDDGTEPVEGEYTTLEKVLVGTIGQYLSTVYQGIQVSEARNGQETEIIEGEFTELPEAESVVESSGIGENADLEEHGPTTG